MKVYFIGAGPGAADLITLRAKNLIEKCPVILYAGSLVPVEVLSYALDNAKIIDTASLTLEEIIQHIGEAKKTDQDVARLHSGDPSIYGAIAEQMRCLDNLKIDYEIIPGVSSFTAAAAVLKKELTLPSISQTIILTRTNGVASSMPEKEDLKKLAQSCATLAIYLSIKNIKSIIKTLKPLYGETCPIVICYRVSWPDQLIVQATLETILEKLKPHKLTRTALILVGWVLSDDQQFTDSKLYDPTHQHLLRPAKKSIS
ncbi:MAG: precorrin-4 C(11)-methyltransferase [Alphaproteobacteria bacterium]|nr:precorrin-4 C(11)-methyltransferase [Alphaproteobacteria bacterium]